MEVSAAVQPVEATGGRPGLFGTELSFLSQEVQHQEDLQEGRPGHSSTTKGAVRRHETEDRKTKTYTDSITPSRKQTP